MNVKGYAKLRSALDDAKVIAGISPVPVVGEEVRFVTIKFAGGLIGSAKVHDALYFSGLSCDDGVRGITDNPSDNPALRVIRANLSEIEFEDMNYMPLLSDHTD